MNAALVQRNAALQIAFFVMVWQVLSIRERHALSYNTHVSPLRRGLQRKGGQSNVPGHASRPRHQDLRLPFHHSWSDPQPSQPKTKHVVSALQVVEQFLKCEVMIIGWEETSGRVTHKVL